MSNKCFEISITFTIGDVDLKIDWLIIFLKI